MAYSTIEDLKGLVPEKTLVLLTDDGGTGSVDEAVAFEAIAKADAEIDAYLGGRYMVPMDPAPGVIKKFSSDIAAYDLYARRSEKVPEALAERYKGAVAALLKMASGLMSVGVEPPPKASFGQAAETNTAADARVFSREKLEGF